MFATIIRVALFIGLAFGGYKLYPRFQPIIQSTLKDQKVLGAKTTTPIFNAINQILPDNIQIPIPNSKEDTSITISSSSNTNQSSTIASIVDSVKEKAASIAGEQVDLLKKETGKAFCQVLLEKIKTECE